MAKLTVTLNRRIALAICESSHRLLVVGPRRSNRSTQWLQSLSVRSESCSVRRPGCPGRL